MRRKVFYSFHYVPDSWRASQVRNIGVVEGNAPASDNDWENVKRGGKAAIQRWIDNQLDGRSCTVVLIGKETANREWINYEIIESWKAKKGVLGLYVHNLKDSSEKQSAKGKNPFDYLEFSNGAKLSTFVQTYDPPYSSSTDVYGYISENLSKWIESAIKSR